MVGQIQRNKAQSVARWAHTAHSVDSAHLVVALGPGAAPALADGRRTDPLRVYVQLSLDGDLSRGGVDVDGPGAVDELCAQVDGPTALDLVGLMGDPAAGLPTRTRPSRGLPNPNIGGCSSRTSTRSGLSAGMSNDLETP